MTLTDLQTRRAGLSASAELLVYIPTNAQSDSAPSLLSVHYPHVDDHPEFRPIIVIIISIRTKSTNAEKQ